METDNTENMVNGSMALSNSDPYDFLKGTKQAAGNNLQLNAQLKDEFQSPLEEASERTKSFAIYTTGTVEMKISPEILEALSELRTFVVSSAFKKLASFITALQADLPTEGFSNTGDPLCSAIMNPCLLATHATYCELAQDLPAHIITKATWIIDKICDQALINGLPVWDRLEGERYDFFLLFKLYRDSRYNIINGGEYLISSRSMAGMAKHLGLSPQLLSTLNRIYSWQTRCAYYDKFFETEMARHRQMEVQIMQRDHLQQATALLAQATTCLENAKDMSPKDAIAMAELGFKISRLSLGLLPDKPQGIEQGSGRLDSIAVNFNQTNADKVIQINDQRNSSPVERKLQGDMKDNANILSVLSILQRSGALQTALHSEIVTDGEVIDDTDGAEASTPKGF